MTKGSNTKNFVKSQPLYDVHRQYLKTFLIDLQTEVSRFRCRIFQYFAYFSKFSLIIIGFYVFLSYPLVIVLHLESFENNLFKLDFSISTKARFYDQTISGRCIFCTVMKFVFRDFCSFPYIKILLKVSDPVFDKNLT